MAVMPTRFMAATVTHEHEGTYAFGRGFLLIGEPAPGGRVVATTGCVDWRLAALKLSSVVLLPGRCSTAGARSKRPS